MDPMAWKPSPRSIGFGADVNGRSRQAWHYIPIPLYGYLKNAIPNIISAISAHAQCACLQFKSSQVNTLPKAKSKTRSKQNKDMHKRAAEISTLEPVIC